MAKPFNVREHDWHSEDYVDEWIARDVTRDAERRPVLRRMLALAPFKKSEAIEVLDVGAGYGVVAEEVLNAFPKARVTLQDYSAPMLAHAAKRLSRDARRVRTALGDLALAHWTKAAGGPFDLAVSGIALHNLRDRALIWKCYREIAGLLKPGGAFLDYDHFQYAGGVELHLAELKNAGFASVECAWQEGPTAIVAATR
jgi:SAM-dependent methyltransferase